MRGLAQEDKDFAFWGVDFQAYARRTEQLGMFLDRRPVRAHVMYAGSIPLQKGRQPEPCHPAACLPCQGCRPNCAALLAGQQLQEGFVRCML